MKRQDVKEWWGVSAEAGTTPISCTPTFETANAVAGILFPNGGGHVARMNPDHMQGWGYGRGDLDQKGKRRKPIQQVRIGSMRDGRWVPLVRGEFPHSRQDNDYYVQDGEGEPTAFSGHRLMHEITFEDRNYYKESELSSEEVRRSGTCLIKLDGVEVRRFSYRDVDYALTQARIELAKVKEFTIRLWDPEERKDQIGRLVYWYCTPAKVARWSGPDGVILQIDDGDAKEFPDSPHEREERLECARHGMTYCDDKIHSADGFEQINTSVFDKNIWWYRDA